MTSRSAFQPRVVLVFCMACICHADLVNILIKEMDEVISNEYQEIVQDTKLKRNTGQVKARIRLHHDLEKLEK